MTALDIGVGRGLASMSLKAAGFEPSGIEPSEPFRDHAIKNGAERVVLSSVEDAEFASQSFDFITFGAVLEHLYSPNLALSRALEWLKPGGIIHAEVPNSDWFIAKLVNAYFRMRGTNYVTNTSPMHSPFHLYEFTLEGFRRNGRALGYQIAEHKFSVCTVHHIPLPLKPLARWWMGRMDTGMQLSVYLRKEANGPLDSSKTNEPGPTG